MARNNVASVTEDEIMANIPGFETNDESGDANELIGKETNDDVDQNKEGDDPKQKKEEDKGDEKKEEGKEPDGDKEKGADKSGDADGDKGGDDKQSKGKEQDGDSHGSKGVPEDLVDPVTGQVIARAGRERRLYEREAALNYGSVKSQLAQTQQQLETLKNVQNAGNQYGLTPEETLRGTKMFASWKANPAETLKLLLTEVQKQGINIEKIGTDAQAETIRQLTAALSGQTSQQPSREDVEEQNRQIILAAQNELRNFLIKYPEAEQHQDAVSAIMNRDQAAAKQQGRTNTLSVEQAYMMLLNEVNKRGLDISKPLLPQLQAGNKQAGAEGDQKQDSNQKPLPNGKGGTGENLVNKDDAQIFANEDDSYSDIIKQAFKDARSS